MSSTRLRIPVTHPLTTMRARYLQSISAMLEMTLKVMRAQEQMLSAWNDRDNPAKQMYREEKEREAALTEEQ